MSSHAAKVRACFARAASTTHEGERAAALDRGWHLLTKHGLDPDGFDIPGRTRTARVEEFPDFSQYRGFFAEVFGACVGCGAVATVGVMCRACSLRADAYACAHERHGYCPDCEQSQAVAPPEAPAVICADYCAAGSDFMVEAIMDGNRLVDFNVTSSGAWWETTRA